MLPVEPPSGSRALHGYEWEVKSEPEEADPNAWVFDDKWEPYRGGEVWRNMGAGKHIIKTEEGGTRNVSFNPTAIGPAPPSFEPPAWLLNQPQNPPARLLNQPKAKFPVGRGSVGFGGSTHGDSAPRIDALSRWKRSVKPTEISTTVEYQQQLNSSNRSSASSAASAAAAPDRQQHQLNSSNNSSAAPSEPSTAPPNRQRQLQHEHLQAAAATIAAASAATTAYPSWAVRANPKATPKPENPNEVNPKAHTSNNDRQTEDRGKYIIDPNTGKKMFQAHSEYGGQVFPKGMGRQRARKRGGAGRGRDESDVGNDHVTAALQTMGVMAASTALLVQAVVGSSSSSAATPVKSEQSDQMKTEPKAEPDDYDKWSGWNSWKWK